jgi:CubicO group peptidase (beta-lactamase class C family)
MALDGLVGFTALGTLLVLPSIPEDILRFDSFLTFSGPAVGFASLATLSFAALYCVGKRIRLGDALSMLAGVLLVVYELVETQAVGNVFFPEPGFGLDISVALWLQPVYIGIGLTMILLGGRGSLPSLANPPDASSRRSLLAKMSRRSFIAKATTIVLGGIALALFGEYAWAGSSTGTSMEARMTAWGPGSTLAYTLFPSRPLPAAASPYYFPDAPLRLDLTKATGSNDPDQFFSSNETTALLAIQHGKLVLERCYNGADRSTILTVHSVTKSWVSAMVGAAIAAGYIKSIDDPVTNYIPELAQKDPRFASMTLRHLLAMQSGLAWDTSGQFNDDSVVWNTTALREEVLSRVRIVDTPGTVFFYNDFNYLLMGIVLERTTGGTVTRWLAKTLWEPLGAQFQGEFLLDSISGGFEKTNDGLTGAPIDVLRLGVLYLNGGNWNGVQLIPNQWVSQTTDYATASESRLPGVRYAMGWWTRVIDGIQVFYAWGDHGEYVMVIPSLDIVVARFGRQFNYAPYGDPSATPYEVQIWPEVLVRTASTVAGNL